MGCGAKCNVRGTRLDWLRSVCTVQCLLGRTPTSCIWIAAYRRRTQLTLTRTPQLLILDRVNKSDPSNVHDRQWRHLALYEIRSSLYHECPKHRISSPRPFWIRIKQQSNGVHTGTGSRGRRFMTKPQTLRVPYNILSIVLFLSSFVKQHLDNVQSSTGSRGQCYRSWGW